MGRRLTDSMVANLKPKSVRYNYSDPGMASHYVRVTPAGAKTFACVTRENGKQKWIRLGSTSDLTIDEARDKARAAIRAVKSGVPVAQSFKAIAEEWLVRHVQAKGLRTESAI